MWALCITLSGCAQISNGPQITDDIQSEKTGDSYIIGPGDILDIALWRDDALVRQVVVLSDGNISFPLVGEVPAAGKTIAELKKDIADKLVDYVPDPVISIEVKQSNSMIIYVTGRVNSPNRLQSTQISLYCKGFLLPAGLILSRKGTKLKLFARMGTKQKYFSLNTMK